MKTAKQFSRQRTRHTFLLQAPAVARCNAPRRLRGHSQTVIAHAKLSVPALLAAHPRRVSRVAASVVSHRCKIGTTSSIFQMLPTDSFRHIPQAGKRHAEGVTHPCGLRPHRTAVSRASGSAGTRRTASRHLARRRQAAPDSSRALKTEDKRGGARVGTRTFILYTHPPPIVPPRGGQMPPRHPCRPDRDAFGPASRPSCAPCRHVAAFPDCGSRPPPISRPRAPFNRLAAPRKSGSEALPEDRPRCRLCSGPGIRYAGYPDRFSSHHSAAETRIRPHRPRRGLLPQSRRRDMSAEDPCAN